MIVRALALAAFTASLGLATPMAAKAPAADSRIGSICTLGGIFGLPPSCRPR